MVDIPIYRQQVRQAPAADTRLNLRATPDAMGAAIGEGVQALGRAAGTVAGVTDRIMAEERQKANNAQRARTMARETKLRNDLQLEYEKHHLDDAVAKRGDFEARYSKGLDDIQAELATDEQRQEFGNWRQMREAEFQGAIRNRAQAEGDRSYDLDFQNARSELFRSIRINADPVNGDEGLAQVQNRLEMLSVRNQALAHSRGLNPEQLAELNRQDQAEAYATVINSYNEAGHSVAAKQLFDQHKDTLEPKARDALQRALELGTAKTLAQQKSAEIWSPDKDMEAMYAEADQIEDQQVQAEVKRRLDERDGLHQRRIASIQDRTIGEAYQTVLTNPLGWDAVSPGARAVMPEDVRQRLEAYATLRANGKDIPHEASRATRYSIESAMSDPDQRRILADRGPAQFLGLMNRADQEAVDKLFVEAKGGKTDTLTALASKDDLIKEALVGLKIPSDTIIRKTSGGKTTEEHNVRAIRFRDSVERRLQNAQRDGKPVDIEVVRKAVDDERMRWTRELTRPDTAAWFGDGVIRTRFADSTAAEQMAVSLRDVPPGEQAAIRSSFTKRGTQPTEQQMIDAYNLKIESNASAR